MTSHCWVLKIKVGYEEEYKKRHDEIWDEMIVSLKKSGIAKYSIFKHGLDLFGYFECENLKETIKFLNEDKVNNEWSEYMKDILEVNIDTNTNFPFLLSKQWELK